MAPSIRLFQFVQKFHQTIGIYPPRANQKRRSIHSKSIICLGFLAQFIVSTVVFLAHDAKSMFDYGFGFFGLTTVINCTVIYILFTWQSETLLNYIENCERFIETSKYGRFECVHISVIKSRSYAFYRSAFIGRI